MPGPIDKVEKRTYVPMHEGLRRPLIVRLVISDEHWAYY